MLCCLVMLLASTVAGSPIEYQDQHRSSLWYDSGLFGAYIGQHYQSFDLSPPEINFVKHQTCDPGYTFISPRGRSVPTPGPMMLDANGELVWMEDRWGQAMDLRVQQYDGQDYITFWRGSDSGWHGVGTYVMLNSSYDVVHEVKAANGMEGDLHEFHIVGENALITVYEVIQSDLSAVDGPKDGWIFDCLFQEISIATGELIFQWRASDHYTVEESFAELYGRGGSDQDPWDWFHINAVDKDDLGNYYISSRYMHTITCVMPSGEIGWRLGGKNNDFQDLSHGAATTFSWQHHVSWHEGNILTIFNNAAYDHHAEDSEYSSGLKIALDVGHMTATLLQEYVNPDNALSHSQGSVQILPSGNIFVDWGHNSGYTEFSKHGDVLCNAHFGSTAFWGWGWVKSYRGFKGAWVGMPQTPPDITMVVGWRKSSIFASWNGATEVKHWRLEGSSSARRGAKGRFSEIRTEIKTAFETQLDVRGITEAFVRVVALDAHMEVLGFSEVLDARTGQQLSEGDALTADYDILRIQFLVAAIFLTTVCALAWKFKSTFRSRRMKVQTAFA